MSMKNMPTYLGFWLVNTLVFYLAYLTVSGMVVLGNANLSPLASALISGLILTATIVATKPTTQLIGIKVKKEAEWLVIFWGVNSLSIWVIARAANYTGLGIAGFWWAMILGFVLALTPWGVWKLSNTKTTKK